MRGSHAELLREPGGVEVSERIRALVKDPALALLPRTEVLLYAAARAQLVEERVQPLLRGGAVVLLDRFVDSSLAYVSCHNIDQLLWHDHDFDNLLARQVLDHLFFRLRPGENLFLAGTDRDANSRPQFSVHLHGHLQFILGSKFTVKGRPGNSQQGLSVTKPFQSSSAMCGAKSESIITRSSRTALCTSGRNLPASTAPCRPGQLVHQFHTQGNVRVEMPAAFHVFRDVPKSLVRLAQYTPLLRRKLTLLVSVTRKRLHRPEIFRVL